MRRTRTTNRMNHTIKKVKCKNEPCEKMIAQFNSLQKYCGKGCEVADKKSRGTYTPKANKVQQRAKKHISSKRAGQMKEYTKLRAEYLNLHPMCEVNGCEFKSRDIHHKFDGADRQKYFLNDSTWMAVCRVCHSWIHEHSIEAKKLGYLN